MRNLAAERMKSSIRPARRPLPGLLFFVVIALFAPAASSADEPQREHSAEALEYFETHVRPLLVERCHDCHGPDSDEAGLRLDSREALLRGGDTGPALVPGRPEQSRLIEAISYRGDIQMPPDGKLADREIEILTQWVKLGAPWPASAPDGSPLEEGEPNESDPYERARRSHWSLQPIARPDVPEVRDASWPLGAIDHFVLARLEAEGLHPSPDADRYTLLRRAKFDLHGLPPTAEEVETFVADDSPDAYARLIDRLLAAPEYGQRWGRHWLDVARYADTKGYVFTAEPRYPYAYTYRDYVIRAFNEDLPFDQFIVEQIAADHLELGEDKRPLAALGFLTLGRRFDNNTHDIIDDRIDVVMRGLMGLTVTCARCHDHKYDPIPTADYYSLYGVFASSIEPGELPLISMPEETQEYEAHQKELGEKQAALDAFLDEHHRRISDELRSGVSQYLVHIVTKAPEPVSEEDTFLSLSPGEVIPRIANRWRDVLAEKWNESHPVFGPWHAFAALSPETFSQRSAEVLQRIATPDTAGGPAVNPLVLEALTSRPLNSMADVAACYGELLSNIYQQWQQVLAEAASAPGDEPDGNEKNPEASEPPTALPDAAAEELRQVLFGDDSPTVVSRERLPRLLDRANWNQYTKLLGAVEQMKANSPAALPRAMALLDAPTPHQPKIFLRGNPARKGEEVPRQFLRLLSGPDRQPFQQGSGRMELARAITDLDNPLTARVIVNRVWLHHFGQGLVRTPDDFGLRSEPPTHPELLDYLAYHFRAEGWSLKTLHRHIMLSRTYQQASDHRDDCAQRDPENRWLWRMNRRRIEFEALRDSILAVAGRLDTSLEGHSVDLFSQPYTQRRAVYGFVDRQSVPGVLRAFDFADPDATTAQRPFTTVPQQALFLMNSPFVLEQAQHLAALPAVVEADDPAERVQALYRAVFARAAEPDEVELALEYIAAQAPAGTDEEHDAMLPWQRYAQALLCTNEFMFVD